MILCEIGIPQFLQNGVLLDAAGSAQFPKWELYLEYIRRIWEYSDESHFKEYVAGVLGKAS
jgi:hypothetical protein